MNDDEVRTVVAGITYVPDSQVTFRKTLTQDQWVLNVSHLVVDSNNPFEKLPVCMSVGLPTAVVTNMTAENLLHWIGGHLCQLENHEVDEWFKCFGVHVKDPHPERKQFTGLGGLLG